MWRHTFIEEDDGRVRRTLSEAVTTATRTLVRLLLVAPARASLRTQVAIGAALYALVFVVLVVLGVTGSSSGILYSDFFTGADPRHLAMSPRGIRSDEYLVSTPLLIAQVQQGLPRFSDVLPGGADMSVMWDVPYREWSTLLRPQNWGFFFLPLNHAFAFKWWLPTIALGTVGYFLLVTLWRRPLAALAVSVAFVFSPFFQWWYGAATYWPPTFGVALVVITIWLLRARRTWMRWLLGAAAGYVALVAIVALYPAFLIPCVLAGVAGAAGWLVSGVPDLPWRTRLRRLVPLAAGGAAAVVVLVVYLATRRATLDAITSTVYPGQRSWQPGEHGQFHPASVFAGVFAQGLRSTDLGTFAGNSSEGSSFLFVGLYLLPVAGWLIHRRWTVRHRLDGVLIGPLAGLALLVAFLYIPGWGLVSRALLLGMTTAARLVIGIGLLSFLLLAVVVHRLVEDRLRPPAWVVAACLALVLVDHLAVFTYLRQHAPAVLSSGPWWVELLVVLVVAVGLFARGRVTVPSILLLAVTMGVSGWVNPLYRGVLDLRTTDVARAVVAADQADPGSWIGLGNRGSVAVLRESAVESYSGTQGWPLSTMWRRIDPTGAQASLWNRYAHVGWTVDPAAPPFATPTPDVVTVRLDTCSAFVQQSVRHILTQDPLDQPCVQLRATVPEPTATYLIYDVVPSVG